MKILNFGSINIDYVYNVDHFVSAGETLSSYKMEQFPGGKGLNQSIALARAGAEVYHAGFTGSEGASLIELMKENGVNTEYTKIAECSSGHAIIQVDNSGENCILLYGGANRQINTEFIDEVLKSFEVGDLLLLQNEINNLSYIIKKAKQQGLQIALNPSPMNEDILSLPLDLIDFFLVNKVEGNQLTGETEAEKILARMHQKFPDAKILLTLGKDGSIFFDGENIISQEIYESKVVDTTAAGDTFSGYFLYALTTDYSVKKALELSSMASSIAVSRMGASTSIPTLKEVQEKLL